LKIAYFVSRFPHLYQTFIRREIDEVARQGAAITVFPIVGARAKRREPQADPGCAAAVAIAPMPLLAWSHVRAAGYFGRTQPRRCAALAGRIASATWRRPADLVKSLAIFPKSLALARRIQREGFDHIHAHWSTHPTTAAMIVSALTGVPFSFAFHAYDLFATRILIEQKIARARFVVLNCRYTLDELVRHYPRVERSKLHLIYNGLDLDAARATRAREPARPPLLLAIGQLIPTKGFGDLLEAWRLLAAEQLAFEGWIIGSGPEEKALYKQAAAAGLTGRVHFCGEQSPEQVSAALARATLLAMPCTTPRSGTHDALPNVVIEAQAAGVPVVATNVFGIPEIVSHEETGLLVPEHDPRALKNAFQRLLSNPGEAGQFAAAAQQRLTERFNLRTNAARLLALFAAASSPDISPAINGSNR
jgi:glycosyltransferase involved in cell wall biosynthesis